MTGARYAAYRALAPTLDQLPLGSVHRELFRDAAEGFLLAQSLDDAELAELGIAVSVTLDHVVRRRRLTDSAAQRVRAQIEACGPSRAATLAA